ncbi:hypothetical protein BDY17DRAFT_327937 [Neohortaea acidophila]|uniref:BTB domain-containing protein n=1 Tax=Neohortaea acidophila TaxID=245834 RepID=A0A6A6PHD4_9PEZI|nr:uncharacterized protein BDY17DRAFT_327937 [Neohortaea acidophila]KAF2479151.1 hypothetical protein BDY17DRAFT_327937 [Neohortaea acidophila]
MAPNVGASNFTAVRAPAAQGLDVTAATITVTVGAASEQRTFYIHSGLACNHSKAIVKLYHKPGDEGRIIRLGEDDPEAFEMFARFLYSGKVHSRMEGDIDSDQAEVYDNEWPRLTLGWRLGDRLQSPSFKDAVVDAVCEKMQNDRRYPVSLYQDIYPHTSAGAPLRRLIVDIAVWKWHAHNFRATEFHGSWNDFFRDLAVRQFEIGKEGRKDPAPFSTPNCIYHEHGDDYPCYRTMF